MKTIQMTIDERLLQQVDSTVQVLHTMRSAFIRMALEQALQQHHIRRLEERDEADYTAVPANSAESEAWIAEQDWEAEWNEAK